MKLIEIIREDQLDEIKLKHVLASAALAGAIAAGTAGHSVDTQDKQHASGKITQAKLSPEQLKAQEEKQRVDDLTGDVLDKYKIAKSKAKEIVKLAIKHEKPVFPKAEDLLAIIGIESSFNPNAKSNLKHDKAIGLTQIRPKIWGIHAADLKDNLDKQVSLSSDILYKYHHKLGSEDKAIHAYNVGLTNVRHGTGLNPKYVEKWKTELKRYDI
jgi:hypothetical protein